MASLNKLAIRGIRSFDDKHVQVIEFYSPLTVIVGHNGSGKTTIIECLKYATTGYMPPNTRNGAFIHDPKMANEKEVKAQVRLRFWNVNRQRMTATRNVQVTMKKGGGLTMKTLEGILAKTDVDGGEGKRNTISTKCSEMDEEVPLLLGVSTSILENVIFCHQEESNWPLSEPAALKKKFDDIFEATKYTKALDNIKLLRKERTAELKVDKERLKFLKADKDKAERMRKQLQDEINKENSKQTQAEALKEEFERLKQINLEYYAQAAAFQSTFEKLERLKSQKEMLEKNRRHIRDGMSEMSEKTDELKHMLKNFDSHLETIKAKKAKQVELKEKEEAAVEDLRRRERNLASTQGGLTANRKNHERNVRDRENTIREAAKTHNLAGYDYSPIEEAKVAEFIKKLGELVSRADSDLRRLQDESKRKERELQAELDRLAGIKTSASATKRSKQEHITQLQEKMRASEDTFESVNSVDADIGLVETRIAEIEEQRARLDQDIREAKYDEQIRGKTVMIRQREADRDRINAELSALNRQADSRAQLGIKQSGLQSKTSQIGASISSHSVRFRELVGSELEAVSMEEKISLAIGRKDREVQEAESSASASDRNLSKLQTSLNIAKSTLKDRSDELSRLEKAIRDGLKESDKATVEEAIEDADMQLKFLRDDMSDKTRMTTVWQNFLQSAKAKKRCLACDRGIHDDEAAAIEKYLTARSTRSAQVDMAELKEDEKAWVDVLHRFRALQASEKHVSDLRQNTMPSLEKQVFEESAMLDKAQEQAKLRVQRAKIAARDLQTLKSAAVLVSRNLGEIEDLKSDLARLERELESTGSLKTVDDVQREVDQIANEIKNLQREQATISGEKELKWNSLHGFADDVSQRRLRLVELRSERDKRQRQEAGLRDLKDSLNQLRQELKDLDASAQTTEAPWREQNDTLNRHRAERQNAENDASLLAGLYRSSLNELEGRHAACQLYKSEGNDRKIDQNEVQLDDIKREIAMANDARTTVESAIASLQDELSRAESLRTNISANVRYRDEEKEIQKVQDELDDIDIDTAARSRREFTHRYKEKLEEETDVKDKWQLASGQLIQMTEGRKKTEETLKQDYRDIDKQFKEQLIKTKVSEFANNDLEKYGKALDNAILKYHAIKMDEINDTIGHLWNKTYQGTDIDGIRIVSDHDEVTSTTTRKSYNYRVVMVKNDVELDMRGRCSAGQKVLASIIIRLALAESFGQGCGVLALDEPTTNLDQENINALAEALAEIIRERRRQANFQLIVITHDEGFLQRLAAHDVLEYYWRVSRDASQKSILERQRVGI